MLLWNPVLQSLQPGGAVYGSDPDCRIVLKGDAVLPLDLIDSAAIPGGGVMHLYRRGHEMVIHVDGRELMASGAFHSERALADLACDALDDLSEAHLLVGGLGMGFTLAAALARVGERARVVVAELVPGIVDWNRTVLASGSGKPLADARTEIHAGNVVDLVKTSVRAWDAILLDVDNGPRGISHAGNDWLYSWQGLEAAHRALRPGGVLAVWSAFEDNAFTRRFARAGFEVKVCQARARGPKKGGPMHTVWLGRAVLCQRNGAPAL